jgi:hypothetical protein
MREPRFEQIDTTEKNVDLILAREKEKRPNPKDFEDVFGPEEIERDDKLLNAVKRNIERDLDHLNPEDQETLRKGKKRSEALEIVITEGISEQRWFGRKARITRTGEFDDVINGVDGVLEFDLGTEEKPERIALAIDASMRSDYFLASKKMLRNIRSVLGVNKHRPTKVKYFKSKVNNHKGPLEAVIPVVIGLEGQNCNGLFDLMGQVIKLENQKERNEIQDKILNEKKKEVAKHPAQRIFIEEIKAQLVFYKELITEQGSGQIDLSGLERLITIFNSIDEIKREIETGNLAEDAVFKEIINIKNTFTPFNLDKDLTI